MSLAKFITASSQQIIGEWEEFARTAFPGADLEQRRDHVAGIRNDRGRVEQEWNYVHGALAAYVARWLRSSAVGLELRSQPDSSNFVLSTGATSKLR